jgi:hypothetical protein
MKLVSFGSEGGKTLFFKTVTNGEAKPKEEEFMAPAQHKTRHKHTMPT